MLPYYSRVELSCPEKGVGSGDENRNFSAKKNVAIKECHSVTSLKTSNLFLFHPQLFLQSIDFSERMKK